MVGSMLHTVTAYTASWMPTGSYYSGKVEELQFFLKCHNSANLKNFCKGFGAT